MEQAYFAGGCFWCVTPVFREYPGVQQVVSGYCGGAREDAYYELVKSQATAHRETIQVTFDPSAVTFPQLMQLFLDHVDPFDPDGQFIDRGFSYSLAVYCTDAQQRADAHRALEALRSESDRQVYVSLEAFSGFYPAEEYHQNYDLKNPEAFAKELQESGRISL